MLTRFRFLIRFLIILAQYIPRFIPICGFRKRNPRFILICGFRKRNPRFIPICGFRKRNPRFILICGFRKRNPRFIFICGIRVLPSFADSAAGIRFRYSVPHSVSAFYPDPLRLRVNVKIIIMTWIELSKYKSILQSISRSSGKFKRLVF